MASLREFVLNQSTLPTGNTVRDHLLNPGIIGGVSQIIGNIDGTVLITYELNGVVEIIDDIEGTVIIEDIITTVIEEENIIGTIEENNIGGIINE